MAELKRSRLGRAGTRNEGTLLAPTDKAPGLRSRFAYASIIRSLCLVM